MQQAAPAAASNVAQCPALYNPHLPWKSLGLQKVQVLHMG